MSNNNNNNILIVQYSIGEELILFHMQGMAVGTSYNLSCDITYMKILSLIPQEYNNEVYLLSFHHLRYGKATLY